MSRIIDSILVDDDGTDLAYPVDPYTHYM